MAAGAGAASARATRAGTEATAAAGTFRVGGACATCPGASVLELLGL